MAAKNLGELLVRENMIDIHQLEKAKKEQKKEGGRLGSALVKLGYIDQNQLAEFLAEQYQVASIDLSNFEIDREAISTVPRDVCEKHSVIPISKAGNTIVVAMADPSNVFARDDLLLITRSKIEAMVAPEPDILAAIERYYSKDTSYESIMNQLESQAPEEQERAQSDDVEMIDVDKDTGEGPIIRFVNLVLADSIKMGASDIHIEPYEKRYRVRYRVDGKLIEKVQPNPAIANAVTSRLKVMSKLDISERRIPQDGRLKINLKGRKEAEFRVSVCPTVTGEKIVMRLLDKSNLQIDMTSLGFEKEEMDVFQEAIHLPYGMVLITGPTGSGKTTTIYSALMELNTPDTNISTAEDPVEFKLDGINQVHVNPKIDLTFGAALKSFLRQDPDIIMVGEIRDYGTADIAMKAAMTGHLVISTLHTNDTPQTVNRLLNMGFEPFLVASTVNIILAQRLLRRICSKCKEPADVDVRLLKEMGARDEWLENYQLYRGRGCDVCNGLGYKGRVAIYELFSMNDPLRELICKGATPIELKKLAVKQGMNTLRMSAIKKMLAGVTSYEEVLDKTVEDEL